MLTKAPRLWRYGLSCSCLHLIGAWVQIPAASLVIQLPANALRKLLSTAQYLDLYTLVRDWKEVPGFTLAQP